MLARDHFTRQVMILKSSFIQNIMWFIGHGNNAEFRAIELLNNICTTDNDYKERIGAMAISHVV